MHLLVDNCYNYRRVGTKIIQILTLGVLMADWDDLALVDNRMER